ncbi:MAG TPA: tetratricopeptide repeat protein [Vicinamibacterales bacterium]|nr:tetratricopeptide repeat protein [Vicinamibacterales bacterium]
MMYVVSGFSRTVIAASLFAALVATALPAAQEPADPPSIAPAGSGLLAVPLPRIDELEPAVSDQIREQYRSFIDVTAGKPATRALADAYGSMGQLLHAYEFLDGAEPAYRNAARLAPGDGRWPHLLGFLCQQTGRLDEAAGFYREASRLQPGDRAAAAQLGAVYLGLNRLAEAGQQFRGITEIFPAVARQGLGEVALREGKFADAIDHLAAALQRAPQASSIHYSLAMAYRGLGRMDQARSHLRQRGPGELRPADPIVDGLQALVRGERAHVIQGRRAYEAGRFQEAADAFSKAVAASPASVAARVNLGMALAQTGDAVGARGHLETALRLDADNVTAHAGLGMMLARLGRDDEAVDHLRAAFDRTPEDAGIRTELVGSLLRLRRNDDAIEVLAAARSIDPDDEGLLVNLSILLADRERYREAVTLLDEAHARFPERAATATTLARLLASSPDLSVRDGRRALAIAMDVYTREPTPVRRETVAMSLAELGRCDEAAEWIRRAVTEAAQLKDTMESARLRGEAAKYETASCRPPGR